MSSPKAQLSVIEGKSKGAELIMTGRARFALGRGGHSDLQIRDTSVSREHCYVECDGDYFWLVDPGSVNGTFVNGRRVQRYMLYDSDVIRMGRTAVVFRLLEST